MSEKIKFRLYMLDDILIFFNQNPGKNKCSNTNSSGAFIPQNHFTTITVAV